MNIKRCLQARAQDKCTSIGLLLVRLLIGVAFMMHGWGKIQNPMAWMGPESPVPGVMQLLAAVAEFGGGLAWILGLLMPVASIGIAITMAVATYMHMIVMGDPFISKGGGSYELAAVYFTIAVLFLMAGPGKFSWDQKVFGSKT